ncbi:MAG: hypothetical protein ACTSVW_02115 [Candidatus Njordarchaeales archaeon]
MFFDFGKILSYEYAILLLILLLSYSLLRYWQYKKEQKLIIEIQEKKSILNKICSLLKRTMVLEKFYLTINEAKELLSLINALPDHRTILDLKFALNYYIRSINRDPSLLNDLKYLKQHLILPLFYKVGNTLALMDPRLKRIWNGVPKQKKLQNREKYLPELLSKMIKVCIEGDIN